MRKNSARLVWQHMRERQLRVFDYGFYVTDWLEDSMSILNSV